MKNRWLSLF